MRKYNDSGWEKVGTLPVDAGCIMLMDPCYTEGHDDHRAGGDYNSKWYTEQIVERCYEGKGGVHEVSGRETGPGSGMIIPSGFGDGYYNVYVRYSDEGSWGTCCISAPSFQWRALRNWRRLVGEDAPPD